MSLFGEDDKVRKMLVVFDYITRYCPKAMREITKVAVANNVRYNPGRAPNDINWARDKSKDQLGSLFRHIMERRVDGKIFEPIDPEIAKVVGFSEVFVMAEASWRSLAQLELDIEAWEAAQAIQPQGETVNQAIDRLAETGLSSEPRYLCCGSTAVQHAPGCVRNQL